MKSNSSTLAGFGCNSKSSVNSCDVGSCKKQKPNVSALDYDVDLYVNSILTFNACDMVSGPENLVCNCSQATLSMRKKSWT